MTAAKKKPKDQDARSVAAEAVSLVVHEGKSLEKIWLHLQLQLEQARDQAFARELVSGTLRWYYRLDALIGQLTGKKPSDKLVHAVLLTGLYQLGHMRVAPHAAISESVNTVRRLGFAKASGLINAVLRRYQREQQKLDAKVDSDPASRYAYPGWMVKQLKADWPQHWQQIMAAGNQRAPMWLRVNRRLIDPDQYCTLLAAASAGPVGRNPHVACAVYPDVPMAVTQLPGFAEGQVSVQDAGAQLAAGLLDLRDGQRVLDACAAPGGKSGHILETAQVELCCVDSDAARLQRVASNLERLQCSATLIHGDAATPEDWWDGRQFDRILLDVPCSASGVIRRHPDIKKLRRHSDLDSLQQQQLKLLKSTWQLLAPGGSMLYATCSIFKCENDDLVRSFVAAQADAAFGKQRSEWEHSSESGCQILPGEAGMDGFYYSTLVRR